MTDLTPKVFKEILTEVLHEKRVVDDDTHKIHHEYIQMRLEDRERRQKLWMKFKLSFVGGLALAVLGFLIWIGELIFRTGHHS